MELSRRTSLGNYWLFFLVGCGSIVVALAATLWSATQTVEQLERAQRGNESQTVIRAHMDFLKLDRSLAREDAATEVRERYEIMVARVFAIEALLRKSGASEAEWRAHDALKRFVESADAALASGPGPLEMRRALKAASAPLNTAFQVLDAGMAGRTTMALTSIHDRAEASIRKTIHLAVFCGAVTFIFSAALWRAARQLERKNRHLSQLSSRLKSVAEYRSQFLANASHELRTPLNAIKGFAQSMLYLGDALPVERQREYLSDIEHSATNLERLTGDLLDLSKIDAGHFELREETVSLDALAERAARCVAPAAEKAGVALEVEAGSGLWVRCDDSAIERSVINLLANAVKFTEAGKSVRLVVRAGTYGPEIEVADQGCGVPEDQLAVIWEVYGRTSLTRHSDKQGAGLGLPISRAMVEAHGGGVAVESVVGEGSVFTIRLPARRVIEAPDAAAVDAA